MQFLAYRSIFRVTGPRRATPKRCFAPQNANELFPEDRETVLWCFAAQKTVKLSISELPPYLHIWLGYLSFTPYYALINSNMLLWVKCDRTVWDLQYINIFSNLSQNTVLKYKKRLPKNVKIFIDQLGSKMGASRFEFSTKFQFSRRWKTSGNIWLRSDFGLLKSTNLLSKSASNWFWDDGQKFWNFKFCQN